MIINGKEVAASFKEKLKSEVADLKEKNIVPKLAIIQLVDDEPSMLYFRGRKRIADELGIEIERYSFNDTSAQEEVIKLIKKLNEDDSVWGIMIDRPVPRCFDEDLLCNLIDAKKDVDGCSSVSAGLLMQGKDCLVPSTAQAVVDLLKYYDFPLVGSKVTIVGRSKTVGKPAALLFMNENSTVTLCHSKTKDVKQACLDADVIVAAVGKKDFITNEFVSEKSVIIDVGINVDENGKTCGDVSKSVYEIVDSYSPVPGGVGPLTSVEIFMNLLKTRKCK